MATIATTLYKNLNTKQRAELINLADPLGINDITELKEFGVSRKDNISKFVFRRILHSGLPLGTLLIRYINIRRT